MEAKTWQETVMTDDEVKEELKKYNIVDDDICRQIVSRIGNIIAVVRTAQAEIAFEAGRQVEREEALKQRDRPELRGEIQAILDTAITVDSNCKVIPKADQILALLPNEAGLRAGRQEVVDFAKSKGLFPSDHSYDSYVDEVGRKGETHSFDCAFCKFRDQYEKWGVE